jgi:hypothetical protein
MRIGTPVKAVNGAVRVTRVRGRETARFISGRIGILVRGPRRASAGMTWVLWDGETEPRHVLRILIERVKE